MKIIKPILFLLLTNSLFSQELKYEYFDPLAYSGYESFTFKTDSFTYQFSLGLMAGQTKGTVETKNDTLTFNSDLQPFKEINEYYRPTKENQLIVKVKNSTYQFQEDELSTTLYHNIGFRLYKKDKLIQDISWKDSNLVQVEYDTVNNVITYFFNSSLVPKKHQIYFVVFRSNLELPLSFNSKTNEIEIVFNSLPDIMDYTFFTNQKAVLTDNSMVLIKAGELEKTTYLYESKKGIRRSKKQIVKEYKTAPNIK